MYCGPQRKLIRKPGFDYSSPGFYFVTMNTRGSVWRFGQVEKINGRIQMVFSEYGQIADFYWQQIPEFYSNVKSYEYAVMPNHVHGIIEILPPAPSPASQLEAPPVRMDKNWRYGKVSKVVKGFKEAVVKEIRRKFNDYDFAWQRSFHDHIVHETAALNNMRRYVIRNPEKWRQKYG